MIVIKTSKTSKQTKEQTKSQTQTKPNKTITKKTNKYTTQNYNRPTAKTRKLNLLISCPLSLHQSLSSSELSILMLNSSIDVPYFKPCYLFILLNKLSITSALIIHTQTMGGTRILY